MHFTDCRIGIGRVRQSLMLLVIEAVAQLSTRSFLESVSNFPIWAVLVVAVDAESTVAMQIRRKRLTFVLVCPEGHRRLSCRRWRLVTWGMFCCCLSN